METFVNLQTSPVLSELAAGAGAAQTEWDKALATYCARHFPDGDTSVPFSEQVVRRFQETATGRDLNAKLGVATRKYRAARDVTEMVNLGEVFWMRDLSHAARERVYAAAANNAADKAGTGVDPLKWAERAELVAFIRKNPRPPTYAEAAGSREKAYANTYEVVNRVLKERGLDPTKWTDGDVQEVAMAQARVEAFKQLTHRAQSLDPIWHTRVTQEK